MVYNIPSKFHPRAGLPCCDSTYEQQMVAPAYGHVQSLLDLTLSTHFDPWHLLVCDMNKIIMFVETACYVCEMHVYNYFIWQSPSALI